MATAKAKETEARVLLTSEDITGLHTVTIERDSTGWKSKARIVLGEFIDGWNADDLVALLERGASNLMRNVGRTGSEEEAKRAMRDAITHPALISAAASQPSGPDFAAAGAAMSILRSFAETHKVDLSKTDAFELPKELAEASRRYRHDVLKDPKSRKQIDSTVLLAYHFGIEME